MPINPSPQVGDTGHVSDHVLIAEAITELNTVVGGLTSGGSTPDASISTKGKVRLANDIGGTADNPTVVSSHFTAPLPVAQGGTGASARSFLGTDEVTIVPVARYGATGNGSTDDTAAIQLAIDESPAGAEIRFQGGATYIISAPIRFKANRSYVGTGHSHGNSPAIIKQKNSTNITSGSTNPISGLFVPDAWWSNSTTTGEPVLFSNMVFDTNAANNSTTTAAGLLLMNYWSWVEKCRFVNGVDKAYGLYLADKTRNNVTITNSSSEPHLHQCRVENSKGFYQQCQGQQANLDGVIDDFRFTGIYGRAMQFERAAGWTISNNHIYGGSNFTDAIYADNCFATLIADNYIEDFGNAGAAATYRGIFARILDGWGVRIRGNQISSPEDAATTPYYIEAMAATSQTQAYVNIGGNNLSGNGLNAARAIRLQNDSGGVLHYLTQDNVISGFDTGADYDIESGTVSLNTSTAIVNEYHPYDIRKLGAVGDDSTDNTGVLQAALDAMGVIAMEIKGQHSSTGAFHGGSLDLNGAGMLYVPATGVFRTGPLTVWHRGVIQGEGHGSVLRLKPSSTGYFIRNKYDSSVHAEYIQIRDIQLDGYANGTSTSLTAAVFLEGNSTFTYNDPEDEDYDANCVLDNVYIVDIKGGDGILTSGSGENRIINCKIHHVGGVGVTLGQDNWITGTTISWTGKQGLVVAADDCRITAVKTWYTGRNASDGTNGAGIVINGDSGVMTGCSTQDNRAQGILLDNAHCWSISACMVDSASMDNAGTYAGFDVFDSDFNQISGLVRNRFSGPDSVLHTLKINSGSLSNDIVLVGAKSPWGVTTDLLSSSIDASNYVRLNGVEQ